MILALAVLSGSAAAIIGLLIELANMMSDSPYQRMPHYVDAVLAAVAGVLLIWWMVRNERKNPRG